MAVHADNLTESDFPEQSLCRQAATCQETHGAALRTQVVKLENDWVALATDHARMNAQILGEESARLPPPPPLRFVRLLAMKFAPGPKVLSEAVTAPPLMAVAAPVGGSEGQVLATAGAPTAAGLRAVVRQDQIRR
jgi:hypothetical protein